MERADIKIGFGCNNHCKFCVQGDKRDFCFFKEKSDVEENMQESYKDGKRGVVFTGGEPTLHPHILDFVKFAKKTGFEIVQIQSNGRMFAYMDFCKNIIDAGATEFSPALHGHNAKIHDLLTDAKGSFDQTVQGISNLKKLGQHVLTNTVVTSKNYKHLPKIAQLLVDLGVDQFQFAFIHLGGTAYKNRDWIIPKKSDAMPYIKKGLDIGIKANRRVMTEAVPYCFMLGYEDYIAEKIIPDSVVYDAGFTVEDYASYRKNSGKVRGPLCSKCKYFNVCEGPWKEYPEIYGWKEFKPVIK
jgi:MoaA/NifB/PqqE/SkfB family radical SAM enzyme